MGLSIEKFISEMNSRLKDKLKAEDYLLQETRKFEASIEPVKRFIARSGIEIASLNGTEFNTDIGTIVEELANMWGVEKEDLSVGLYSTLGYSATKPSREKLNTYLEEKARNTYLNLRVSAKTKAIDNSCVASIYTPFRLNTIQADGRPLIQHLHMSTNQYQEGQYEITAAFEDINKIVLPFRLGDLVTQSRNGIIPDNAVSKAIIQAIETYNSKENDIEMAD